MTDKIKPSDDGIYCKLREFLHTLSTGYPETETGVEIKILKKLFTPEHAQVSLQLTQKPEPVSAIAQRLNMEESQAAKILEAMTKKGLIFSTPDKDTGKPLYSALQYMVGIFELQVESLDRELAELMEEYLPYLREPWKSIKTKQFRVVPIGSSINPTLTIFSYDQISELIKDVKIIGVAPCICARSQSLMGKTCDHPLERCLVFNNIAQRYIESNMARQINKEELLDMLKMGEEKALVLSLSNTQNIINICLCCKCCCGILRMLNNYPQPAEQIQSSFQATLDPNLCIECRACIVRCPMGAITEGKLNFEVNKDRCIGCGLCIPTCPQRALSFQPKPMIEPVPKNILEMRMNILKERKLI